MGNYNYTVGELTSMIRKELHQDIAILSSSETEQNKYIWYYMTLSMWKYVSLAYVVRTSDPLAVSVDGYVTFKSQEADIEDLYEQLRILDDTGLEVDKRPSFVYPTGWYRESANSRIHIKGAGTYTLQYKAYPNKAVEVGQVLEWPASSYDLLMFETIGKIKESKNQMDEAGVAYAIADKLIPILIKANEDARGTTGGRPPSQNNAIYYRR